MHLAQILRMSPMAVADEKENEKTIVAGRKAEKRNDTARIQEGKNGERGKGEKEQADRKDVAERVSALMLSPMTYFSYVLLTLLKQKCRKFKRGLE